MQQKGCLDFREFCATRPQYEITIATLQLLVAKGNCPSVLRVRTSGLNRYCWCFSPSAKFFYFRMGATGQGSDPIADYYRNVSASESLLMSLAPGRMEHSVSQLQTRCAMCL